ncbi:MAG: hypothetical protein K5839_04630 [Treponemataceae bacterium]|nr:hypothetical protein [Treponemataceae bacterium]
MSGIIPDPNSFKYIDAEEFYDAANAEEESISTDIVVLTREEKKLISYISEQLSTSEPDTLDYIAKHIRLGEKYAQIVSQFPSLLHKNSFSNEIQTRHTLAESLLEKRDGDRMLYLPTKATLGKGLLVAKFHAFSSLLRISKRHNFSKDIIAKLHNTCLNILFTIMTEDVYVSLLDDDNLDTDIRRQIAYSLILLWEHRSDQNVEVIAPILNTVWKARRKLAPAFGTMVGTSELILLSIEMGEDWRHFIATRLGDSDVSSAMEEYLFGISYEKILKIKNYIREKGLNAVNRDEASSILGEKIPDLDDEDLRNFYMLYSIRRDDAAARKRMNLPGPHQTLEAHYMKFILECNKERQENDTFAK